MMIYTDVNDVSMYKIDCHKIQVTTERKMNNLRGQRFRFTALETSVSHAKGIFKLRKNRLIIPRWLPEMSRNTETTKIYSASLRVAILIYDVEQAMLATLINSSEALAPKKKAGIVKTRQKLETAKIHTIVRHFWQPSRND